MPFANTCTADVANMLSHELCCCYLHFFTFCVFYILLATRKRFLKPCVGHLASIFSSRFVFLFLLVWLINKLIWFDVVCLCSLLCILYLAVKVVLLLLPQLLLLLVLLLLKILYFYFFCKSLQCAFYWLHFHQFLDVCRIQSELLHECLNRNRRWRYIISDIHFEKKLFFDY